MKSLRLQAIDAANRLGIRVGADLKNLVVVDEHFDTFLIGRIAERF
jgi:hypothetical protein